MRTALIHDWLTGMRGGEKVLEALSERFPAAPIYTLIHNRGSVSAAIEIHEIRSSFIQKLPGAATKYQRYLPFFPAAIERFDLRGFDLVLSTSHCVAKGVVIHPGTKHLCYCHTPMRYVWSAYEEYFGEGRVGTIASWVLPFVASYLRNWDVTSALRVDSFAANSAHVQARIERYYGRPARVIHPLVDTEFYTPDPGVSREGFYLVVTALVPYKRVELVLEAAKRRPIEVVIVGSGVEQERLEREAPSSVRFLGWQDANALRDLYRRCRALFFPGEEDFGIVPVEAQACGAPVIGLGRGGLLETVREDESGVFFREPRAEDLVAAIDRFESQEFSTAAVRRNAERFGRERFEDEVTEWLLEDGPKGIFDDARPEVPAAESGSGDRPDAPGRPDAPDRPDVLDRADAPDRPDVPDRADVPDPGPDASLPVQS